MKVIKNSLFNLIGLGAPLLVAIWTIPLLIHALGAAEFGLLTLIWAVVSYFGLFDLGLGRALTLQLAVALADDDHERVGPLVGTAIALMAALGVLAGGVMAGAASWGVSLIHEVPDRQAAVNAVFAMAVAMPFVVLTSGFRGILEASHAFGVVNLIRLPMGLFTFLGPLAIVLTMTPRLDYIAWTLVAGRVIACVVHAYFAWRVLPGNARRFAFRGDFLKPLCVTGGWLTVSNVISPFMGYVDRFVIGAIVSASAVAFYTTPQELVTKLWILPGALTAVLFPAFAAQITRADSQTLPLFKKGVWWLFLIILPAAVVLTAWAREILTLWVGDEFANQGAVLMQIFAVGILVNCLAHVPFTLIQSAGASRLTALAHFVELPLFLLALWALTSRWGPLGAAVAWLLRMVVDTILMFVLCSPLIGKTFSSLLTPRIWGIAVVGGLCFFGALIPSTGLRVVWTGVVIAASLFFLVRSLSGHRNSQTVSTY